MPQPQTPYSDLARQFRQQRFNPLFTLTPALLTSYLDQFEAGYLRGAALVFREIAERDDVLFPCVSKRLARVSRRRWEVVIGEEIDVSQQAEAEAQQALIKSVFSSLQVREATDHDEIGNTRSLFEKIAAARLNRYALGELQWDFSGDAPRLTVWHVPLEFFENTTGVMRFCGASGISSGQPITRENWIIAKEPRACMKAAAVAYMFKRLPLADWLNLSELFGIPGLHMETNAAKGSAEWDAAAAALEAFANDFKILTSVGEKLNTITPGGTGETPSTALVDRMDRALARLIMGSDLATLSRENGAGASMQGDEMDELTASDCEFVSEVCNEQIVKRLLKWRFGEEVTQLAYLQITPPSNDDTKLEMEIDKHVKDFGVVLPPEDLAERYNRTHDESESTEQKKTKPAENERVNPSAEAKRRAALLKQFQSGVHADLAPLARVLESIAASNTPDELRGHALALSANLPQISEAVLAGNAATDALAACVATEFLAGLQSLHHAES